MKKFEYPEIDLLSFKSVSAIATVDASDEEIGGGAGMGGEDD